jgi:DNA gyrase/topoisomerase IV subunit A
MEDEKKETKFVPWESPSSRRYKMMINFYEGEPVSVDLYDIIENKVVRRVLFHDIDLLAIHYKLTLDQIKWIDSVKEYYSKKIKEKRLKEETTKLTNEIEEAKTRLTDEIEKSKKLIREVMEDLAEKYEKLKEMMLKEALKEVI